MPSSRSPAPETRLICSTATGACAASRRAQASAVSSSSWSSTRRVTSPSSKASSARIGSPTRFISSALPGPTRRGRRWVPPKPGRMPSLISGWPNSAERAAMRMSQAIASSQPPPKARPLTAAIVTIPSEPSSRSSAWPSLISFAPAASSMVVNDFTSAPGAEQHRVGGGDHERPHAGRADRFPDAAQVRDHLRGERVHLAVGQPGDRDPVLAGLELDRLGRLLGVRAGVGVEALAALLAEPSLGHQAAQDRGRREALAVALAGALHPLEHGVEAFAVGPHERRQQAAAGVQTGAGHHPEVDIAVGGDALLEHQAGLEEGLQRQHLDERLPRRARSRPGGWAGPAGHRSRRRRSWRRVSRRRPASACPWGRRSVPRRRTRRGARPRAGRCPGRAG